MSKADDRHAQCLYGRLTEAVILSSDGTEPMPSLAVICAFPVPTPCPPALRKQWGGSILITDCLACPAFEPVPAVPFKIGGGDK